MTARGSEARGDGPNRSFERSEESGVGRDSGKILRCARMTRAGYQRRGDGPESRHSRTQRRIWPRPRFRQDSSRLAQNDGPGDQYGAASAVTGLLGAWRWWSSLPRPARPLRAQGYEVRLPVVTSDPKRSLGRPPCRRVAGRSSPWHPASAGRKIRRSRTGGGHQFCDRAGSGRPAEPPDRLCERTSRRSLCPVAGRRVLWLPAISGGANYQSHDGPLQNSDGTITVANRSAAEAGFGMYAVGGARRPSPACRPSSPCPMPSSSPRIADQEVAARRQATAAANERPGCRLWPWRTSICCGHSNSRPLRRKRSSIRNGWPSDGGLRPHRTGQSGRRRSAADGACACRNAVAQAAAQTRVASARLAGTVHIDPSRRLAPQEAMMTPIGWASPRARPPDPLAQGLLKRPELGESLATRRGGRPPLGPRRDVPLLPSLRWWTRARATTAAGRTPPSPIPAGGSISTPPSTGSC